MDYSERIVPPPPPPAARVKRTRLGEMAGTTAANCATFLCCFPFGVLDLVFTCAIALPAGAIRRTIRRVKRRRAAAAAVSKFKKMNKAGGAREPWMEDESDDSLDGGGGRDQDYRQIPSPPWPGSPTMVWPREMPPSPGTPEWGKAMRSKFFGFGARSFSLRDEDMVS